MKKEIRNHESLLKKLVLDGDAHAFFSLSKPYFQERYLRERSSGTPAEDTGKKVLAEAIGLLEEVRHVSARHLDAWLEEHCPFSGGPVPSDDAEIVIDAKIIAETEFFLAACSRALLQAGSDIKRTAALADKKFPRVVLQHRSAVFGLLFLAIVLIAAGSTFLMIRFRLGVEVQFLSPAGSRSLRYPPAAWSASAPPVIVPEATDTSSVSDSTAASKQDTLLTDSLSRKAQPVAPAEVSSPASPSRPRSLPPVVPKARMILPPPPPPPPVPVEQPPQDVPGTDEPAEPFLQEPAVPPSSPPPSPATESSY